ncbi:hypothetical protein M3Y94_00308200 [Aphelenchoides besseyi]|nr:hypothetical protein M3Y94_00308200 [Aphelenchoides besseyi]KAI6235763.1 hypothetical protein M3Y95_00085800 [Aphelenchoides besseyi]
MWSKSSIKLTFFSVLLSTAVSKVSGACLLFNETVIVRIVKECNGILYTLTSQEKHFELTILAGETVEENSQWNSLIIGGCEFSFRHSDMILLYSAEKDHDNIQYLSTARIKSPSEHLLTRRRNVPQESSQLTISKRTPGIRVADANLVRLESVGESSVQIHGY